MKAKDRRDDSVGVTARTERDANREVEDETAARVVVGRVALMA